MARRLITYLCIDTSGSMNGEPIVAVNAGLQSLIAALRSNPYALDTVHLALTTFDSHIQQIIPLTPIADVVLPEIRCPASGATLLGAALEDICVQVERDVRISSNTEKGDWKPILVILTDGKPTDTLAYSEVIPKVQACQFSKIVACAAGPKSDVQYLRQLTPDVVSLSTLDAVGFMKFFEWVSATFTQQSQSMGVQSIATSTLPPPPAELNVVL